MQVTDSDRAFAELVRDTRFGTIEHIRVSGGRPVIDANTEVCTEYRLSGVEPGVEMMTEDQYVSKPQVRAMFERFRAVGDGIIECLEVRDGLPFKMTVRRSARA